jgi:hypothetical protein
MRFLMIVLVVAVFSCEKDSVEVSPEKPVVEKADTRNLDIQKKETDSKDVPEEKVKEFFRAYVVAENVALKVVPSNTAEDAGFVQKGDMVDVLSKSGHRVKLQRVSTYWFKVKTNDGTTGWVYGEDLDFFSTDPGYLAGSDLQLLHEPTIESSYSPKGFGNEFLGTVDYLTVDENAGIKEVYLFDKYIFVFINGGYTFNVFDYDENLKFADYPVFGNLLADVSIIMGPMGIWNDFLVVSSVIGDGPRAVGNEAESVEIYDLKEGRLSFEGTHFDTVWPNKSTVINVYEKLGYDYEKSEFSYREYSFDFSSGAFEPTGETKIYVYADLQ